MVCNMPSKARARVQAFHAVAERLALSPNGKWAAVATRAGTVIRVDTATLAVAVPALLLHAPADEGATCLHLLSDDVLLSSSSSGQMGVVQLHPQSALSASAPSTLEAALRGVVPNLFGPGGYRPAQSGLVQLGDVITTVGAPVATGAQEAPTLAECTANDLREVRSSTSKGTQIARYNLCVS